MGWTSILAIYFLIWVMSAFVMLSIGVRTTHDQKDAEIVPGQAESAPVNFKPGKLMIRATIIATVLTTLFVLNFEYGWIGVDAIDILPEPPTKLGPQD